MNPALYIVLPVHNRRDTTRRFVSQLAGQTLRDFTLIVVDDGSTDGTADAIRAVWPASIVVRGEGNLWWAGGLSRGCEEVQAQGVREDDVLLFINDDVEIAPDFLAEALREMAQNRNTLLLARQYDAQSGDEIDHGGGVEADLDHLRFRAAEDAAEINCLPTRGLFLRWRDFQRIGGFRPAALPHYLSDYEFTVRAKRRGLALRVAESARVRIHPADTGISLQTLFTEPRSRRVGMYFSPRCKDNPATWSRFAALASPPCRRPLLWVKIWAHAAIVVARCLVQPARPHAL